MWYLPSMEEWHSPWSPTMDTKIDDALRESDRHRRSLSVTDLIPSVAVSHAGGRSLTTWTADGEEQPRWHRDPVGVSPVTERRTGDR